MKSKKRLMGLIALAAVLVAGGVWLFCGKTAPVAPVPDATGDDDRPLVRIITETPSATGKRGSALSRLLTPAADKKGQGAGSAKRTADDEDGISNEADDEEDTPEEKAVKRWEDTIAEFYEETEDADDTTNDNNHGASAATANAQPKEPRVTLNDQLRIRDAFREMTEENRMEEVHHAMNLLPDESVAVIYGVLFDKTQPEDIMDVIFSDILNRDESIKILMMREIAKDPTHPMYAESVRILEITDDDD